MGDDPKVLTPQQKKALSYANDRRNTYGQNDKAARKAIPLNKALGHRAARHADKVALEQGVDDAPPTPPKPTWKKSADTPLGEVVKGKLAVRAVLDVTPGKGGRRKISGQDAE
jgi:hypothetical protein